MTTLLQQTVRLRAMSRLFPLLMAAVLTIPAISACKDNAKTKADASATAVPSASISPKAKVPPPPPPDALDVAALQKALKCGGAGHGPCNVLAAFKDCKKWSPITDSGDGRWVGMANIVKKGAFTEELMLLRSKRVNVTDVGPGQLNVKIAMATIPDTYAAEQRHARKALDAYKRGDVPTATNQGVVYIKKRENWQDAFAMQAKANQIFVADQGGAYLCQMTTDQRLLVIRKSNTRDHAADGVYAVFYPVSW